MGKMTREKRKERAKQRQVAHMKNGGGSGGSGFKPIISTKDFEDVDFYKIKKGKNRLDIIPFLVTVPENMPTFDVKYVEEDEVYLLSIWRHTSVGPNDSPVICLNKTFGKACPICEARKEMMDNGVAYDSKEEQAVRPKWRAIYNVIDLDDEEKGIQIYDASGFQFQKEMFAKAEYLNEGFETFSNLEDGATVTFRGSPETFNKKEWFKPMDFGFESREPYEEDIFDDVYPLDKMLVIPTYEEVQNMFLGLDDDEQEDDEQEKEESTKKRSSRKTKKSEPKEEKEEPKEEKEEPKEEKEEPKEEKTKSRRSRKKKDEPKEDDGNQCPFGYVFGADLQEHDECDGDCPQATFDLCDMEKSRLDAMPDPPEEKEEKEEKPKSRRRNRR